MCKFNDTFFKTTLSVCFFYPYNIGGWSTEYILVTIEHICFCLLKKHDIFILHED